MGTGDDNLQVTVGCRKKSKLPVSSRTCSLLRKNENSWTYNQALNRTVFLRITHQEPSPILGANSYLSSRKFPAFCGNWNITSLPQNPATGPVLSYTTLLHLLKSYFVRPIFGSDLLCGLFSTIRATLTAHLTSLNWLH